MYLPSGHLLSERGFEDNCAGMEDLRHWFPLTYHCEVRSWAHVSWAHACDCMCILLSICKYIHTYKIHCFIRLDAFKFKVSKHANNYNIISQKVPTRTIISVSLSFSTLLLLLFMEQRLLHFVRQTGGRLLVVRQTWSLGTQTLGWIHEVSGQRDLTWL